MDVHCMLVAGQKEVKRTTLFCKQNKLSGMKTGKLM